MLVQLGAWLAIVATVMLVRHVAARRVAAGDGRFVWFLFGPEIAGGLVILWAASQIDWIAPLIGLALVGGGLVYGVLLVRYLVRVQRSVSATQPGDDISVALTEPMVDFFGALAGLGLTGGVFAVVALVIWGITQARP